MKTFKLIDQNIFSITWSRSSKIMANVIFHQPLVSLVSLILRLHARICRQAAVSLLNFCHGSELFYEV